MRDSVRAGATVAIMLRADPSTIAGLGFLVSPRAILTCAHVVKKALAENDHSRPTGSILVRFLLLEDSNAFFLAEVAHWEYEPDALEKDIAGLTLEGTPPEGALPGLLSVVDDVNRFSAFGIPSRATRSSGVWSEGDVRGVVAGGLLQLDSSPDVVHAVQPGFSGTSAWDLESDTIVGMVVAASGGGLRDAYIIPSRLLISSWAAELGGLALPPSPYRGLTNFSVPDGKHFFGREAAVSRILSRLAEESLTVLVGPSGVGKTSIVYAGVLAQLERQGQWRYAAFRPGDQPLSNLAMGILELEERAGTSSLISRAEDLRASGRFFPSPADLAAGVRHLLFVDQLEELFADVLDEQAVNAFLDLALRRLPYQAGLHVIVALRSDFYAALLDRPGADSILDSAQVQVSPMGRTDLMAAIEKPAALYNVRFEQGLVGHILDEAADERGALPLVEFALSQLWQYQRAGELRFEHLVLIGGVRGSVLHQADRAIAIIRALGTPEATIDETLVKFFRRHEPTAPPTRRIVTRAELTSEQLSVVERLVSARLVSSDVTELHEGVYELAHETVIQSWSRLSGLAETDGAFVLWRTRMESWLRNSYGSLPFPLVQEGLSWLRTKPEGVVGSVRELVLASSRKLEAEKKAQQEAKEAAAGNVELLQAMRAVQEAESAERTHQTDGVVAQHARRSLEIQHTAAAAAILRRTLDSANLQGRWTRIDDSVRIVHVDHEFALLRGAESTYKLMTLSGECFDLQMRSDPRPGTLSFGATDTSIYAISLLGVSQTSSLQPSVVQTTDTYELFDNGWEYEARGLALVGRNLVAVSPTGFAIARLGPGNGDGVDVGGKKVPYSLNFQSGQIPQLEVNGEWLVIYSDAAGDRLIVLIEPAAPMAVTLDCPVDFEQVVVAKHGAYAAAWSSNGLLAQLSLRERSWKQVAGLSEVIDLVVSPDGSIAAARSRGGLVHVVDFDQATSSQPFLVPDASVVAMAVDNTGRWVATAHIDGHCNVLDSRKGEVYAYFSYPGGAVTDVVFSPGGSSLVIGGDAGPLVMAFALGAYSWSRRVPAAVTSICPVDESSVVVATGRTDIVCVEASSGRVKWERERDTALARQQPESLPLEEGEADKVIPRNFRSLVRRWVGDLLVAIYADGSVELLTRDGGDLVQSVHSFGSEVTSAVVLPDHRRIWVALRDRSVRCLEIPDSTEPQVSVVFKGSRPVEVLAAGENAVLTIENAVMRRWTASGSVTATTSLEHRELHAVSACADIVVAIDDENIVVLGPDLVELSRTAQFEDADQIALSPSCDLLAVAHRDSVSLIALQTMAVQDELSETGPVEILAFGLGGRELLLGDDEGIIWSYPLSTDILLERAHNVEGELAGYLDIRVEVVRASSLIPLQLVGYHDDTEFEEMYGPDRWNA